MKEIIGHDGYFIDETGNVFCNRSINGRGGSRQLRQLKVRTCKYGYIFSGICIGGRSKIKSLSIHRLVAIHFIPNPENKPQVNHINGVKSDNRVCNLEWCTAKENMKHAKENGLSKPPPINIMRGSDNPNSPLTNEQVISMRKEYQDGNISQRKLAKKYKIRQSSICKILNRSSWSHV